MEQGGPGSWHKWCDAWCAQSSITGYKTKAIVEALERWGVPADEQTLLIVEDMTEPLYMSTRNLPRLKVSSQSPVIRCMLAILQLALMTMLCKHWKHVIAFT